MALPCSRKQLASLKNDALFIGIIYRRKVARAHRDARLHERCWITDYLIWEFLDDSLPMPDRSFFMGKGMELCKLFYRYCQSETPDPPSEKPPLRRFRWDYDLVEMKHDQLVEQLFEIQQGAKRLRDASGPRIPDDYRKFYGILPENASADFLLGSREDFLRSRELGKGCANFWNSHAGCPNPCNFHNWGPC